VSLLGRVFYTRFSLEKQGWSSTARHSLFRTPLREPATDGVHRTHRLSAFQTVPDRQRTPDPLLPDRRRAGVDRDACTWRRPATDVAHPPQGSAASGISPCTGRGARANSHVSVPAAQPVTADVRTRRCGKDAIPLSSSYPYLFGHQAIWRRW